MKKLLALTLTLASLGFMGIAGTTEAKANAVTSGTPQVRIQIGQRRRRDRDRYDRNRYDNRYREIREERQTRIVRSGWHTYRETFVIRYLPNGRTETRVVSRDRIN